MFLSGLGREGKRRIARRVEEILARVPSLGKYLRVDEVCYRYDLSGPECATVDYEWECPCVLSVREVSGQVPSGALASVSGQLSVDEIRFLARNGLVKDLVLLEDDVRKVVCQTDRIALEAFVPYDDTEYVFRVYEAVPLEASDGTITLYKPLQTSKIDQTLQNELYKCVKQSNPKYYIITEMALKGLLPKDKARELLSQHLPKLSPYAISKLVKLGVIQRDDAVRALREIAARRRKDVTSMEELNRIKERSRKLSEQLQRFIEEAKRIVNTLQEELGDMPVEIRTSVDVSKLKIKTETISKCLDGEWTVDEDNLNVVWVCNKKEEIEIPNLVVEDQQGERNVYDVSITVVARGWMPREKFQHYLKTVKKLGLRFCPSDKSWRIRITPEGPKRPRCP